MIKVDFEVVGLQKMNCAGCEARVQSLLEQVPGVQHVLADSTTQHVAVMLDPEQVTPEQVKERLTKAGYEIASGSA